MSDEYPSRGTRWVTGWDYKVTVLGAVNDRDGDPQVVVQSGFGIIAVSLARFNEDYRPYKPEPKFKAGDIIHLPPDGSEYLMTGPTTGRYLRRELALPDDFLARAEKVGEV
jgi:hypothetical protein